MKESEIRGKQDSGHVELWPEWYKAAAQRARDDQRGSTSWKMTENGRSDGSGLFS